MLLYVYHVQENKITYQILNNTIYKYFFDFNQHKFFGKRTWLNTKTYAQKIIPSINVTQFSSTQIYNKTIPH